MNHAARHNAIGRRDGNEQERTSGYVVAPDSMGNIVTPGRKVTEHARSPKPRVRLTIKRILEWADAHHARTGVWPVTGSGPVRGAPGETWSAINAALSNGTRGLRGGTLLAHLLHERRGVRNRRILPRFKIEHVLAWVDAHYERTGKWPNTRTGPVREAPDETWAKINSALVHGQRGLPGGMSLAARMVRHRGASARYRQPRLTIKQILAWADAHHQRTKQWPRVRSGPVRDAPGENWRKIDNALLLGLRGLPPGSSLAKRLDEHRGVRNRKQVMPLTIELVLGWADAHHRRTGRWPMTESGTVHGVTGETWSGVNGALWQGSRGLRGGASLARLLAKHRGVRNRKDVPTLSRSRILAWARAHHKHTGRWPMQKSGAVLDAPGETWNAIDKALRRGTRGLRGRSSLRRLIGQYRY